ncbi:hypothetical protein [Streptomyces sp. HNM0574]|uniref:hypothetical protein n=1 Tax=Streptomyces sp. HNM0574 TaxID=2714954 RepID=UPI00146B700C|nr:hypothetical protein [Streptomyces sp. HNM0574]NLU67583.1 hypothetical protein [Streptomyces sp. HNM0574]
MTTRAPASPRVTVLALAGVLLASAALAFTAVLALADGGDAGPAENGTDGRAPADGKALGVAAPASPVPYVRLRAGDCFDHPGLSRDVTKTERRRCTGPHDGEVVAERRLKGTFRSERDLRERSLALCADAARQRLARIPQDGRAYRPYAVHPALGTYEQREGTTVACALTLRGADQEAADGPELTAPLPGA